MNELNDILAAIEAVAELGPVLELPDAGVQEVALEMGVDPAHLSTALDGFVLLPMARRLAQAADHDDLERILMGGLTLAFLGGVAWERVFR